MRLPLVLYCHAKIEAFFADAITATASSSVPVKQYNRVGGNWSLYVNSGLITALLGERS